MKSSRVAHCSPHNLASYPPAPHKLGKLPTSCMSYTRVTTWGHSGPSVRAPSGLPQVSALAFKYYSVVTHVCGCHAASKFGHPCRTYLCHLLATSGSQESHAGASRKILVTWYTFLVRLCTPTAHSVDLDTDQTFILSITKSPLNSWKFPFIY